MIQKLIVKVCPSGMYQQEVGKLECKNCPAGTIRAISSNDDDIHWNGDSGGNDGDRTKADDETDCKVCEAGRYQNNERQTDCIDCPAGTRRPSTTGSDGQDWDGSTAMSGGNRNVADTKEDCKVCDSGQYQHENKQTECINCPEGTVRYVDTSDNDVWNGANVLDTFHEFTIGHCEETGDNLISTHTIDGPISSYFSDAFQQYVVTATTKCNSDSNCEYVSVWDDGDYRLYKNACTPGYVTKTDSSPPDMSVSEIECERYGTDNSLIWQGNHHVNIAHPKGCFTDGSSNIYYNKAATGVTCGGTYTCIENGNGNKVYNEVDVIVDEQNVVWDGIVGYWYPVTYKNYTRSWYEWRVRRSFSCKYKIRLQSMSIGSIPRRRWFDGM